MTSSSNNEGEKDKGVRRTGESQPQNEHNKDRENHIDHANDGKKITKTYSSKKSGIFSRRMHSNSNSSIHQNDELSQKILDVATVLEELRRFDLEPASIKEFTITLHKLAVASGVAPSVLTSIIKEINNLCEGNNISLTQARKQVEELRLKKRMLLEEMDDLMKKKQSLEVDLGIKKLEFSVTKQTLSEYLGIKKELEQHQLSFSDVSKLITLIKNANELLGPAGPSPSSSSSSMVVETLTDLKSKQDKRRELENEIEELMNSKRMLQEKLVTLEDDISNRQQTLNSAEKLEKMGLDFKELDKLHSALKMIAETRNIDVTSAKNRLLSDLEGYYANEHELRKRIRVLESLLQEKEDKFKMLEEDYQNEQAALGLVRQLISDGFDIEWIQKLQTVIGKYGMDLDLLSKELEQYKDLKVSIIELHQKKKILEEEERFMRQKVVAVEDQRIRTLSIIKDMLLAKRPQPSPPPSGDSSRTVNQHAHKQEYSELGQLIGAAQEGNDDNISDEARFRDSARKAIDVICKRMKKNSPARVVLEHALTAMRYEDERNKQT